MAWVKAMENVSGSSAKEISPDEDAEQYLVQMKTVV
jgi:hypothetical protein